MAAVEQLQMSWCPNLRKRKRESPPVGLRNLGNTCYLNSVLQCLTYTPPLANFCLKFRHAALCNFEAQQDKKTECPFCLLEKRIARSLSIDLTVDSPAKIINSLEIFAKHFKRGRQEDAHEFLCHVIDVCHDTCIRLKKLRQQQQQRKVSSNGGVEGFVGSTVVKEIFGGVLQSQVKCLTCGTESNKVEEIIDISLDISKSSSIEESFQKFFHPEILDGSNKYDCDSCKKLVTARKQLSILQAPNVFVIQLKRFEGIFGRKIDKAVSFKEVLVLSSFMSKANQDAHPEYSLFATIVHSGISSDTGHYYAYIKDALGRWYCCNDSYVSLSTSQELLSEKVYILFYSRTKQRPLPAIQSPATNGTKVYSSNGNSRSKSLEVSHSLKSAHESLIYNGTNASGCNGYNASKSKIAGHAVNSNGTKSYGCNGNSTSKSLEGAHSLKSEHESLIYNGTNANGSNGYNASKSQIADHAVNSNQESLPANETVPCSSEISNGSHASKFNADLPKDNATSPRDDKVSSSPQGWFNCSGSYVTKKFPKTGNLKIIIRKQESEEKDNDHTSSTCVAKRGNELPVLEDRTCSIQNKLVGPVTDGKSLSCPLANGNSEMQKHNPITNGCKSNGSRIKMADGNTVSYKELENDGVDSLLKHSGSKRKLKNEDGRLLFAKVADSQEKYIELKKDLENEVLMSLKSCGWSDEVYTFMHSKKKLYAQEAATDASNDNKLKRLLIADAKSKFISQIPQSLKGSLIKRLRTFDAETHIFDP